jgi:hypothetical protein
MKNHPWPAMLDAMRKKTETEYHVILIAFLFGVLIWIADAFLDYVIFYENTFWNLLILEVPPHEIYIRLVILLSFLAFGFIISKIYTRQRELEKNYLSLSDIFPELKTSWGVNIYFFQELFRGRCYTLAVGQKFCSV